MNMQSFDQDKQAIWEKLAADLIVLPPFFGYSILRKEQEIHNFILSINQAFSESLDDIASAQAVETAYSPITYSNGKSLSFFHQYLDNLSEDFGSERIPMIYSTQILRSREHYPVNVWREIESMENYINPSRFGRINFISALLNAQEKGLIKLLSFEFLHADNDVLIMRACVRYEAHSFPKQKGLSPKAIKLSFNKETGEIAYGNDEGYVKQGKKDYALLCFLSDNKNCPFKTQEILDSCNPEVRIQAHKFKGEKDIWDTIRQIKGKLKITNSAVFPIRKTQNEAGETRWKWLER